MPRLSAEEREALEAIPDEEYARQQIQYHQEQIAYWEKELNS